MFYAHIIRSFESEVASPKVEQIYGQEEDCLYLIRISPKHSAHNYALNDDYNKLSERLKYHSG